MTSNDKIYLAAILASMQAILAENEAYLAAHEGKVEDRFTVGMRIRRTDGKYSTFSALRALGDNQFNWSAQKVSNMVSLPFDQAEKNRRHFARQALQAGKRDMDYQVVGICRMIKIDIDSIKSAIESLKTVVAA